MGEVAEDTIDGTKCSHCGTYFKKTHGYPVICKDCHLTSLLSSTPPEEMLPKADADAEFGEDE